MVAWKYANLRICFGQQYNNVVFYTVKLDVDWYEKHEHSRCWLAKWSRSAFKDPQLELYCFKPQTTFSSLSSVNGRSKQFHWNKFIEVHWVKCCILTTTACFPCIYYWAVFFHILLFSWKHRVCVRVLV